jgi:hypothetical protein
MRIKLPQSRKGRVWTAIGAFVGVVSIFGAIGDATADPRDHRYEVCMTAYHDAKHCYEDVYGNGVPAAIPTDGPAPTDIPIPHDPTGGDWAGPVQPVHTSMWFNPDAELDSGEVIDLR